MYDITSKFLEISNQEIYYLMGDIEYDCSQEEQIVVDIEIGETSSDPVLRNKQVKKPFNKLVSGILSFKSDSSLVDLESFKTLELSQDKGQQSRNFGRKTDGKSRKTSKPPRHPKAPLLDAADVRLVKEISKIAIKKHEGMVHTKALKKMKATKLSFPSAASSASTISAMVITVVFFVIIICQGLGSKSSLNEMLLPLAFPRPGAPQPSPQPTTQA